MGLHSIFFEIASIIFSRSAAEQFEKSAGQLYSLVRAPEAEKDETEPSPDIVDTMS